MVMARNIDQLSIWECGVMPKLETTTQRSVKYLGAHSQELSFSAKEFYLSTCTDITPRIDSELEINLTALIFTR